MDWPQRVVKAREQYLPLHGDACGREASGGLPVTFSPTGYRLRKRLHNP
jgi:hypothetical protein